MTDALHALAGSGLCLLMLARVRMLRGTVTSRSLWIALMLLGLVQLTQVGPLYRSLEHGLGRAGSAALLAHALTILAAAATRELQVSLTPGQAARRWHYRWAALALAVMAVAYLAAPASPAAPELAGRSEFYDSRLSTAVIWAAYLLYLNWALAGMFASTRRLAQQTEPGPLRTALRLGAVGIGVGFGYVALKVAVVALWLSGDGPATVRFDAVSEAVVLSCSLLLIGTASAFEALSARIGQARLPAARRRSLRRLQPLADALQTASAPAGYGLPAANDQLRLIVLVTAIRDAQRSLRGYEDPQLVRLAELTAARAGHRLDAQVFAEAVGLRAAQQAKARGARPRPSRIRQPAGGRDLPEEVRYLERLAQAYAHPLVQVLASRADNDQYMRAS